MGKLSNLAFASMSLVVASWNFCPEASGQISDNFQSATNWSREGDNLTIDNGVASFSSSTKLNGGGSALVLRNAIGRFDKDWSVQVDVRANRSVLSGSDYLFAGIRVSNITDRAHVSADIVRFNPDLGQLPPPPPGQTEFFSSSWLWANDDTVWSGRGLVVPSTSAALKVAFDSSKKILTTYCDPDGSAGGYQWHRLDEFSLENPALGWSGSDSFSIRLYAASSTIFPAGALTFDNFSATGLTEIQDKSLANVSLRTRVGPGETLIAGFVIGGSRTRKILIRAVGPGLTPLGVSAANPDPQFTVFSGNEPIASNDNWGGSNTLATTFASVGAFALSPSSKDAALALSLAPGRYTAHVTGVGVATGEVLIEVYDLP